MYGYVEKDAYASDYVYLAPLTDENLTSLVASNTWISTIRKIAIPGFELLVSVTLSRLTATFYRASESVIRIEDYYCWTDSKTVYHRREN